MRIGQFSESFLPIVDGVGRVVYSYANGLAKGSDECYVIAPQNNTGYRGGYPFELVDYSASPVIGSPQYKSGLAVLDKHYLDRMEMTFAMRTRRSLPVRKRLGYVPNIICR